jgi:CRP-like cAMP-binding protein
MTVDALVKPLLRLEIFQGLRPLQITEIARRAERMVFSPGQIIVHAGAAGDGAFVIVSGEAVCISRGASRIKPEPIEQGSLIGELAMLVEHDYAITVIARGPVRALKLVRETMHELMSDDVRMAEHISTKITSRLANLADELRGIDRRLAYAAEAHA